MSLLLHKFPKYPREFSSESLPPDYNTVHCFRVRTLLQPCKEISDNIYFPGSGGYTRYSPGKALADFGLNMGPPPHEYLNARRNLEDFIK